MITLNLICVLGQKLFKEATGIWITAEKQQPFVSNLDDSYKYIERNFALDRSNSENQNELIETQVNYP